MNEQDNDPYLTAIPARPLAGIRPELLEVLRRRRDRALAREAAPRGVEDVKRELPQLFFRRPT